jgi:uroporphyrinogen decarboxylase
LNEAEKAMSIRHEVSAILHYEAYSRMPVVHFGFWNETLQKWHAEGHLTEEESKSFCEGTPSISAKLGFDFNWFSTFFYHGSIHPAFERKVLETMPDGSMKILNHYGVVEKGVPGAGSIPMELDHTLKDRASWEEHYLPRLQFSEARIQQSSVMNPADGKSKRFAEGGLDILKDESRSQHYGLYCGSLMGDIRNWLGIVNLSYLMVDDEELLEEIITTVADLDYRNTEYILKTGAKFDFAHFWEDMCFKNGPLVSPTMFSELVGSHYKRITGLLSDYGIDIVSVDCDGCIDLLVPIWLENGVNTMFPIEVGTWDASIAPWREKYGRTLRGVGGMNKSVFARDRAAVDAEIERLRPLVDLGGFIPCPDHRLAPDAEWDNVRYYCDRMHAVFSK